MVEEQDDWKLYRLKFDSSTKKNLNSGWVMVQSKDWLTFCAELKIYGFRKKSKIGFNNLTKMELDKLYSTLFPPKKAKNPVENVLTRDISHLFSDSELKVVTDNFDFNHPNAIDTLIPKTKYKILRQPTFFVKNSIITAEKLEKKFTPEAIKLMEEDGFVERFPKLIKPIFGTPGKIVVGDEGNFKQYFPLTFEEIFKCPDSVFEKNSNLDLLLKLRYLKNGARKLLTPKKIKNFSKDC